MPTTLEFCQMFIKYVKFVPKHAHFIIFSTDMGFPVYCRASILASRLNILVLYVCCFYQEVDLSLKYRFVSANVVNVIEVAVRACKFLVRYLAALLRARNSHV